MRRNALAPPPPVQSTQAALQRLLRRGSIYTFATGVQISAALLVVPAVTRLLPPAAYGAVTAGLVVYAIIGLVAAAGLPEAGARTFFRGEKGPHDAQQLVAATLALATAVALIAELTGPLWAEMFSLGYSGVLRLGVWAGAAAAVMNSAQSLLRAADRAWAYVGIALTASLGVQALALTLSATVGTPTSYMAGLAIGTGVAAVAALTITGSLRHGLPRLRELRAALAFGLPLIPHSLAIFLLAMADRVAIVGILGLAAAGRYQVAYAIGSVGVALVTALNQAWLPLVLGTPEERRWEVLLATSRAIHRLGIIVAGGLAVAAPLALLVAAPSSYSRDELVPVTAIVGFSILPYATLSTFFHSIFITGRTKVMAVAAPVAAVVNIALNVALLSAFGLVVAALATVAAYVTLAFLVAWVAVRRAPLAEGLRNALRCWALAAPLVTAGALLPSDMTGALLRAGVGLVILAALLRLTIAARSLNAASPQSQRS